MPAQMPNFFLNFILLLSPRPQHIWRGVRLRCKRLCSVRTFPFAIIIKSCKFLFTCLARNFNFLVAFCAFKMKGDTASHSLVLLYNTFQSLLQASYLASICIWPKVQPHNRGLHATFQKGGEPPSLLDLSQHPGPHWHLNSSSSPASLTKNY